MSDKSKGWINLVLGVTALCAIVFNWFGARELTSGIIQGASTIVTGVARGQSSGSSATSQSTNYSSPSRSASAQPTSPPERVACRACNGGGLCPRCNGRRELTYQCALCFGKGGVKSVVLEWMNDFTSKMRDGQGYEGSRDYVQCPECKGRGTVVDQCLVKKLATGAFYVCSGKCLQCAGRGMPTAILVGRANGRLGRLMTGLLYSELGLTPLNEPSKATHGENWTPAQVPVRLQEPMGRKLGTS